MADTIKASVITDHAFRPGERNPYLCEHVYNDAPKRSFINAGPLLIPEPVFRVCRMAEAAHRETTVKR